MVHNRPRGIVVWQNDPSKVSASGCPSSSSVSTAKKAKRQLNGSVTYDKEHQTRTQLEYNADTQNRDLEVVLWCSAHREYNSKICCMKSYSEAWALIIIYRTSNLLDCVVSDLVSSTKSMKHKPSCGKYPPSHVELHPIVSWYCIISRKNRRLS